MSNYATADASDVVHTNITASEDAHTIMLNRVSWGGIFAGVVVALAVQIILSMLGIGIGVATLDPQTNDNPSAGAFSTMAGIWYIASGIIGSFAGGYMAARMSGKTLSGTGALHGLATWAFTTVLMLYLLTTAVGSIVGGALSGVATVVGGVGQTVAQAAGPALASANPLEIIERQIKATGTDPEALNNAAVSAIQALVTGDAAEADAARENAVQTLSTARNINVEEARTQVAAIEQRYNQTVASAKQQAAEIADTAAKVVSTGALIGFLALVLGAIAAWIGGLAGVVTPVVVDRVTARQRL